MFTWTAITHKNKLPSAGEGRIDSLQTVGGDAESAAARAGNEEVFRGENRGWIWWPDGKPRKRVQWRRCADHALPAIQYEKSFPDVWRVFSGTTEVNTAIKNLTPHWSRGGLLEKLYLGCMHEARGGLNTLKRFSHRDSYLPACQALLAASLSLFRRRKSLQKRINLSCENWV